MKVGNLIRKIRALSKGTGRHDADSGSRRDWRGWRRLPGYGQIFLVFGGLIVVRKIACAGILAFAMTAFATEMAAARTVYDGWWNLTFLTQRGACDSSYNFTVQVKNGMVSHPNLVKFRGRVARGGAVRASVTVHDKHASGTGRMSRNAGQGRWSGYSGKARCSGNWTAQRA
jgi:hypothetical protein